MKTYQLRNKFCLPAFSSQRKKKTYLHFCKNFQQEAAFVGSESLNSRICLQLFPGNEEGNSAPSRPCSQIDWKRTPKQIHCDLSQNSLKHDPLLGTDLDLLGFLSKNRVVLQHSLPFPIQRINCRKWGAPSLRRCALPSASIPKRLLLVLILAKVYPEIQQS